MRIAREPRAIRAVVRSAIPAFPLKSPIASIRPNRSARIGAEASLGADIDVGATARASRLSLFRSGRGWHRHRRRTHHRRDGIIGAEASLGADIHVDAERACALVSAYFDRGGIGIDIAPDSPPSRRRPEPPTRPQKWMPRLANGPYWVVLYRNPPLS